MAKRKATSPIPSPAECAIRQGEPQPAEEDVQIIGELIRRNSGIEVPKMWSCDMKNMIASLNFAAYKYISEVIKNRPASVLLPVFDDYMHYLDDIVRNNPIGTSIKMHKRVKMTDQGTSMGDVQDMATDEDKEEAESSRQKQQSMAETSSREVENEVGVPPSQDMENAKKLRSSEMEAKLKPISTENLKAAAAVAPLNPSLEAKTNDSGSFEVRPFNVAHPFKGFPTKPTLNKVDCPSLGQPFPGLFGPTPSLTLGVKEPLATPNFKPAVPEDRIGKKDDAGGGGLGAPSMNTSMLTAGSRLSSPPSFGSSFPISASGVSSPLSSVLKVGSEMSSSKSLAADEDQNQGEDDEAPKEGEGEEPGQNFIQASESDAIFDMRCKLYSKPANSDSFVSKGLAHLFVKELAGGKKQLLVRAENCSGSVLSNCMLTKGFPLTKKPKSVLTVDPSGGNPTTILIRVKDDDAANRLYNFLKSCLEAS